MFFFVFIVILEASRAAGTSTELLWRKRPMIVPNDGQQFYWVGRNTGSQKCEKIKNQLAAVKSKLEEILHDLDEDQRDDIP